MGTFECPVCHVELDYLDTIVNKETGIVVAILYICHNDDCICFGTVYHGNSFGDLIEGDPTGTY